MAHSASKLLLRGAVFPADHWLTAFSYDRKTEASLLSHAADLDQLLSDRYPDEHHADDFHQRYQEARTALRRKVHTGS